MHKKKLRILIANWTWFPSGGDWTYIENLCAFYESLGHEVVPFSMHDERNFATPYSEFFIEKIDYKELNRNKTVLNGISTIRKTTYSTEARNKLSELLDKHPVDIAHLNNVHHYLTPASIVPELRKRKIPVIWTLHDYVILCPNTTFTSHEKICEKCKVGKFYNCVTNKCKKGSTAASMVAALESYTNSFYNPYKYVDYFICPSEFIRNKFEAFGFDKRKLKKVYNLFDVSSIQVPEAKMQSGSVRPSIVYVGRIEKVKGVFTMAEALADLDADVYILGHGEAFEELDQLIRDNGWKNIQLLGKKPKEEVFAYVNRSSFVIVPSEWYENLPYSLVEALLLAKPVLGADIGGIPELVINGFTGYLFTPGNVTDLRSKASAMLADPAALSTMGVNAKKYITEQVNYETFGTQLKEVYQQLSLTL